MTLPISTNRKKYAFKYPLNNPKYGGVNDWSFAASDTSRQFQSCQSIASDNSLSDIAPPYASLASGSG